MGCGRVANGFWVFIAEKQHASSSFALIAKAAGRVPGVNRAIFGGGGSK
jgi:hypothetical protein